MSEARQMGIIRMSPELLVSLLCLPEGTQVERVQERREFVNGFRDIEIVVSGPQLPVVQPGQRLDNVTPMYDRRHADGLITFRGYR